MNLLIGIDDTDDFGILYPFACYLLFRMIGGLLSTLVEFSIRRDSQKSPR